MTPELLKLLQNLCKEYRIDFVGEIDPKQWPECHKTTLASIQELGRRTFDTYADGTEELNEQPWRLQLKLVARKLVESAQRCQARNESSWRMACEPLIFNRLSTEVVW
jgi:hypothetical protein